MQSANPKVVVVYNYALSMTPSKSHYHCIMKSL